MENHHHHHHQSTNDTITKRTFFNKYKPIKKLGEGSFGKIYSSININTNEKFALKMVKKNKIKTYKTIKIGKQRIKSKSLRSRSIFIMLFKRM